MRMISLSGEVQGDNQQYTTEKGIAIITDMNSMMVKFTSVYFVIRHNLATLITYQLLISVCFV